MYVMGYRRLGNLETPGEIRGRSRRARKYRRYRVARRVAQRAKNRLGVYCVMIFCWKVASLAIFLHNHVGRQGLSGDGEVERNSLRLRLVFRPPSPRIECGRNHVDEINSVVADRQAGFWTNLPGLVIEDHREVQLAPEVPGRAFFTKIPHAK